ncbi:hypothetical protein ACFPYI_21410 [Halomarina salina]|uniref:Uncharacterized protein n=1 Tax=Halomarina salina TaxID=1872699 RepID=A0ABD5RUT5_9EURY|nr:hypothetical protein [Halomarina salina]
MSRPAPPTNDLSATTTVPLVVAATALASSASAGVPFAVALAGGVGAFLLSVLACATTPVA